MDCDQQNTHATFLTFAMPCPLDHIDCVNNKCFCSTDKVTTTNQAASTTSASLRVSTTAAPVVSTTYSLHTRLICPKCDANLTCKWNQSCYPGEVCMLRQYHIDPFTVHCSEVNYRAINS
nr:uncharacterized protein LOC117692559 [Crassostrea gigas]